MITGSISVSDYLAAQRLHRKLSSRRYLIAAFLGGAAGAIVLFLGMRMLGLILLCAGLGGIIGELASAHLYLPWKVRHLHSQQKDLASPFTYTWDTEWLEAAGISGYSKRKWKDYVKLEEDEHLFLLYHSDNLFEMFPKNWFSTAAKMNEFRDNAKQMQRR